MKTIVLIAFYNKKALGVRYLQTALEKAGYRVKIVFYKNFNSVRPSVTTDEELLLLKKEIEKEQPVLLALSVMSSMYLDTVHMVIDMLKSSFDIPIVCGGAYASMFPERLLDRGADFVARCDGEITVSQLADAVANGSSYEDIPSLCFVKDGKTQINEIGNVLNNIDEYGLPTVNSKEACFIDDNKIVYGDPQLDTRSYEVIASRGCPFTCSYCCCNNLRKLLPKGIRGVRTRSVKSVIEELKVAKKECKKLCFIHFYDEVFPNLPGWVDEFVVEYKKHIDMPFTIWSHPKMIDGEILKKLKSVGLSEIIMGIQSGSDRVRRDIFHRYESRDDIIDSVDTIKKSGVFWNSFDFMLLHPFEEIEDLKDTYYLVKEFKPGYELQLHGLNFLPGTDICDLAIEQGKFTEEELNATMYAPMNEQFRVYWHQNAPEEGNLWYKMIFCLQFKSLKKKIVKYEDNPVEHKNEINKLYNLAEKLEKSRYLYKKGRMVLKKYIRV